MIGLGLGGTTLRAAIARYGLVFLGCAASVGCGGGGGGETTPVDPVASSSAWWMHAIDDRFRGANGLAATDIDDDGMPDFVASFGFDQRYTVAFHPGFGDPLRRPWPAVVAFVPQPLTATSGIHPEDVTAADFDGDGNPDLAAAQGFAGGDRVAVEGRQPGVRLVWGPAPGAADEAAAWVDGGILPATEARGHFLFVQPRDLDRDGAVDLVAGGRVHSGNGLAAGLVWIEAPESVDQRRDLSAWQVHTIDPFQLGGSDVVFDDVDEDGDPDLVLANAGVGTPSLQEELVWYENPAPSFRALRDPWIKHVIYANSEFDAEPPVAVADLDRDGRNDVLTQTAADILWFRKLGGDPVAWRLVRIPKPAVARQPSTVLRVADLDDDGRLDLVGLTSQSGNVLPGDRAAAFWMSYAGDTPRADNWTTQVIKWGSGRTMDTPDSGETWTDLELADLDADGDLDMVATCESWLLAGSVREFTASRADAATAAVRWFENRLDQPSLTYTANAGLVAMEAEQWRDALDGTWVQRADYPGFAGAGYLQNHEVLDGTPRAGDSSRGVSYRFEVPAGAYYVWVRRWVPATWGRGLGSAQSNSLWLVLDGVLQPAPLDDEVRLADAWIWARTADPVNLAAGGHTLQMRVREAGYAVDRLLVSNDPNFVPAGTGPAVTAELR